MATIRIPVSLTFMGGGMPWVLEGELTTEWTNATVSSPYVLTGYWDPGYTVDVEWTVEPEPSEEWVLQA